MEIFVFYRRGFLLVAVDECFGADELLYMNLDSNRQPETTEGPDGS